MKNIVLLFLLFLSFNLNAQWSLESSYNSTNVGRNVNLLLKRNLGQNDLFTVYGGLKYHIGSSALLNQKNDRTYWKNFYPTSLRQNIGFTLGGEVNIPVNEHVSFFGFLDYQYTRSDVRQNSFTSGVSFREDVIANEFNLGIGLKADLTERIGFIIRGGGGVGFIKDENASFINGSELFEIPDNMNFIGLFTVGVNVKLGK